MAEAITAEAIIRLEGLGKTYRTDGAVVEALRDVDLTIHPGEFVAAMGPSGSGKSTLMNLLGCLDRPTAGRYWLAGHEVSRLSRNALAEIRNRQVGFVFQSYNLLARTTALENVELPLVYGGMAASKRRQRARDLLASVGLSGREHHMPSQLSGGQQQRVAIARALANGPKLLLADEPTGALDTRSGLEIMAIFQDLNRSGVTVVMVTHEADVARYASRQISFRDGRLVSDQTQHPDDAFAAVSILDQEVAA
jgi:putative ABC transport system ATP-binding protein